jgi:hypothetical protein
MLHLPIAPQMSHCWPIYPDLMVAAEAKELLPCELGAIVGDDWVGDHLLMMVVAPKT